MTAKIVWLYRTLIWIQGIYTLITALWPLIHIKSFMFVTGPKNDIWLVKTVGACLSAVGLTLLSFLLTKSVQLQALVLGLTTAIGMAAIDFYYSGRKVISPVYRLDGIAELLFVLVWILIALGYKKHR